MFAKLVVDYVTACKFANGFFQSAQPSNNAITNLKLEAVPNFAVVILVPCMFVADLVACL